MTNQKTSNQPRIAKWGWGILVFIAALMALNGVMWFFYGPASAPRYMAEVEGMSEEEFNQRFPELVTVLIRPRRQVAVWYAAFGSLALLAALEGFRQGTRWIWNAMWIVPTAPIGISLIYYTPGQLGDAAFLLPISGLAIFGLFLARRGLVA